MSTTQSSRHLENTLDRITVAMGEESSRNNGIQLINSVTEGTIFENCLNRCETRLASTTPLIGRPFLRNDEPEIITSTLSLHHAGYLV
jgi:hypothetical protein